MDDVLILISQEKVQDELHVQHNQETRQQIFCKVSSASRAEFFAGGQSGISPAYRFEIFPADYAGETELEFHNHRYAVYRTFQKNEDVLELYVQQKGGVQ